MIPAIPRDPVGSDRIIGSLSHAVASVDGCTGSTNDILVGIDFVRREEASHE